MLHGVLNFIRFGFFGDLLPQVGENCALRLPFFLVADVPISEYSSATIIYIEPS